MSESVYAVAAYIARYWFAFLAVVMVWRAIVWLRKDAERVSRAKRKLPDAGFIGEWAVVASDAPSIKEGAILRAPRDGWIGSGRGCDVRLRNAGVPAQAARFFLQPDGLHVQPLRSGSILVDGEEVQREAILRHGATLTVGGVTLQLRLFAGVLLEGETPVHGRRRRKHKREELPDPILPHGEEDEDDGEEFELLPAYYAKEPADAPAGRVELPKPALIVRSRKHRRP